MDVGGHLYSPVVLPLGKELLVPISQKAGRAQDQSGRTTIPRSSSP